MESRLTPRRPEVRTGFQLRKTAKLHFIRRSQTSAGSQAAFDDGCQTDVQTPAAVFICDLFVAGSAKRDMRSGSGAVPSARSRRLNRPTNRGIYRKLSTSFRHIRRLECFLEMRPWVLVYGPVHTALAANAVRSLA